MNTEETALHLFNYLGFQKTNLDSQGRQLPTLARFFPYQEEHNVSVAYASDLDPLIQAVLQKNTIQFQNTEGAPLPFGSQLPTEKICFMPSRETLHLEQPVNLSSLSLKQVSLWLIVFHHLIARQGLSFESLFPTGKKIFFLALKTPQTTNYQESINDEDIVNTFSIVYEDDKLCLDLEADLSETANENKALILALYTKPE